MFWKKKVVKKPYDKEIRKPAIRCSICTGERVAGFLNQKSGKFEEIQLIQRDKDLTTFLETYGISKDEITEFY